MHKEHEEILNEVLNEKHEHKPESKAWKPIYTIISLFLALILVAWIIPSYVVKIDPIPKDIPTYDEVVPEFEFVENDKHSITSHQDYLLFLDPSNSLIKQIATKIATESCESGSRVCQAKALFYFVRDEFDYVSESDEYIETAEEVLITGGSDCDGAAVLLANLMQSIGIPAQFAFVPRHVFVQVYLNEALNKYKTEDEWINVDPTCRYCNFGEIPGKYADVEIEIVSPYSY
jgi:transglutaminase-like putative cysteine protease